MHLSPPGRGDYGPLRRLAVTNPPDWGFDRPAARMLWTALEGLGFELFQVDIATLLKGDREEIDGLIDALVAFGPQAAVATPNAGYGIRAALPDGRNLFLDLLEIPTLLPWDSVVQFPDQLLGGLPATPEASGGGVLAALRAFLGHPLLVHAAYDSGQVDALAGLEIVAPERVILANAFAYPEYLAYGEAHPPPAEMEESLAFTGSLRRDESNAAMFAGPLLEELLRCAVHERPLTTPVWDALSEGLARFPLAERERWRMVPDHGFFWRIAYELLSHWATGVDRLRAIAAVRGPVSFYGRSGSSGAGLPENLVAKGCVDMIRELPRLNAATGITLDVINRISHRGITAKVLSCFAAGGFSLFDWRPDFHAAVGAEAEAVMFRDLDEMNDKIDRYLGRPALRRELAEHLRAVVAERFSATAVFDHFMRGVARCHGDR